MAIFFSENGFVFKCSFIEWCELYIIHDEFKTENSNPSWCILVSWRMRTTRHTDGKVTRCRSDRMIFFRRQFWSSRIGFYRKYYPTRKASIQEGNSTYRFKMEIFLESEYLISVRYCHLFWWLSWSDSTSLRCKVSLLLSYTTTISVWFSESVSFETSFFCSPFFCYCIFVFRFCIWKKSFEIFSNFYQFSKCSAATGSFYRIFFWDYLSSDGYRFFFSKK